MISRRFDIRPIASRRLRAALLLVLVLGLIGVSQTSLSGVELIVALLALCTIFADGWRRTRLPAYMLIFEDRPLSCRVIDSAGIETSLRCRQASIYPWLIVLKFDAERSETAIPAWLKHPVILLPDSLPDASCQHWRRLLVWGRQMRRQLASA